jgi:transcriptional regulator with XRE-family HTH domain
MNTPQIHRGLTDPQVQAVLGGRLRAYREAAGLTQMELAERAGLTVLTIHKAEQGANFTARTLLRILRALGRLEQLDAFLPPVQESPLNLLEQQDGR